MKFRFEMIFPFVSMISSVPERTATLPESVPAASTGEMASRKLRNRSQLEILTNRSHHPTGAYTNTVLLPVSIFFGFVFYHRTCHSLHSFPSNVRPQICTLTVSVFARPHTISQSIFICLGHPSTFIFQRPSSRTSICLTHSSDKFASSICVRHSSICQNQAPLHLLNFPSTPDTDYGNDNFTDSPNATTTEEDEALDAGSSLQYQTIIHLCVIFMSLILSTITVILLLHLLCFHLFLSKFLLISFPFFSIPVFPPFLVEIYSR